MSLTDECVGRLSNYKFSQAADAPEEERPPGRRRGLAIVRDLWPESDAS